MKSFACLHTIKTANLNVINIPIEWRLKVFVKMKSAIRPCKYNVAIFELFVKSTTRKRNWFHKICLILLFGSDIDKFRIFVSLLFIHEFIWVQDIVFKHVQMYILPKDRRSLSAYRSATWTVHPVHSKGNKNETKQIAITIKSKNCSLVGKVNDKMTFSCLNAGMDRILWLSSKLKGYHWFLFCFAWVHS